MFSPLFSKFWCYFLGMKTLILTLLMSISSLSAFADCKMSIPAGSSDNLQKILKKKGFEVVVGQNSTFNLILDHYELIDPYVRIRYGKVTFYDRVMGYSSQIDITRNGKFVLQVLGDIRPNFPGENYSPTYRQIHRSYKKVLRKLKRELPDCEDFF